MNDEEQAAVLRRIADALERLSPPPSEPVHLNKGPAFFWDGKQFRSINKFAPVPIECLTGIDDQKKQVIENSARHANGYSAHDILLWGARGMGKSALTKSTVKSLQDDGSNVALIEISSDHLDSLPQLFQRLGDTDRPFLLFIDDISFEDDVAPRLLRSMLEGGVSQRPPNARLYVTSNRRHIVTRSMSEQDDPVNPRDIVDDKLALSDRFGLRIGFHAASQEDYLAMIENYARVYALNYAQDDALLWSKQRGSRSGRTAWQYMVELAGRAGRALG